MRSLRQIIKQAVISLVTDDSHDYPRGQADYNGKTTEFLRYSPYGLFSNPPKGSWILLLGSQGQESTKAGLISDYLNRKKNIKEGECGLYDVKTGNLIYLKENGDIEIDCKNDLTATVAGNANINVTGNVVETVGGNVTANVTGNVNATAVGNIDFTAPNITLNGNIILNGSVSGTGGSTPIVATNGIIGPASGPVVANNGISGPSSGPVIAPNGATINGIVNLSGTGGPAVARVGDTVAGGVITSGSANVSSN